MKRYLLALAGLVMLTTGAVTTANAVEFGVGPNGVYVGPDRPYYREHEPYYREHYAGYGNCRVVISQRVNRYGEAVEIRRRICD